MGLLKPATNQTAFLKLGMLGFEGSGKTFTAVDFAIGMAKLTGKNKVAFFDTEKGSDFHIDRFKKAGVALDVHKSKAFADVCQIIREAEAGGYSFLIIDSITHVWRELCQSWLKKKGRNYLTMKDWGVLKAEWAQYTDLYVNSKLHIAMLGRAGYEYDTDEDEDGKDVITKSGTKMKVETETGFEPDLLLEMCRVRKSEAKKDKKAKGFINRCVVLKDRTDTMNGNVIDQPKFKDFASVVKFLNLGGEHVGTDAGRTSEGIFGNADRSYHEAAKQREIALEELNAVLVKAGLSGTAADKQKARIELLERVFSTSSKRALEEMSPDQLWAGLNEAKIALGQKTQAANGSTTEKQETF
jgi:hypothetical protein